MSFTIESDTVGKCVHSGFVIETHDEGFPLYNPKLSSQIVHLSISLHLVNGLKNIQTQLICLDNPR